MADWRQTDISALNSGSGVAGRWAISAGGVAGTASHSAQVGTGGALSSRVEFGLQAVGTDDISATWVGVTVVRLNITTANTNVTWGQLQWWDLCQGMPEITATITAALGISLGTTGVKTASVEVTAAYTIQCSTASTAPAYILRMSNAATMAATFNYLSDQLVTVPFTASAAPAPSAIFTLAQMNVGQ